MLSKHEELYENIDVENNQENVILIDQFQERGVEWSLVRL